MNNRNQIVNGLIITADDFGMSLEVNQAIETAHREGLLSAASLMVAGAAAEDAVRRARALPHLRVGLHLVMVEGRPTLPAEKIERLVDASGAFRSDMISMAFALAFDRDAARQARAEIEAQFEAYAATGLPLDHVNAHKHFHLHPTIASGLLEAGRNYGLRALRVPLEPSRVLEQADRTRRYRPPLWRPWVDALRRKAARAGVASPDAVFGLQWSGAMTQERLKGILENLPPGVVEVYTHPATRDDFPAHAPGYRYRDELDALCDPLCKATARRSGRPLGGYADFLG